MYLDFFLNDSNLFKMNKIEIKQKQFNYFNLNFKMKI